MKTYKICKSVKFPTIFFRACSKLFFFSQYQILQVLVGELPPHFLRLAVPIQQTAEPEIVQPRMVSFVPPNTRGRLSVTILEANLVKNYGLVRMDPYCR